MDKYEYTLKIDQIKSLFTEENYEEAAEIADTVNWNKVKNVNDLVKIGEVYEKAGRYEDSREILLNAYDNSPIGRTILYKLAEIAVKTHDIESAREYYNEFIDIAPHDNQRYVLKYHIAKGEGATNEELISILEEFKDQEYIEEWAYELAYLYHKTNAVEKCIDSCDELILWFGDGPYVERALELKMLYQPLTKAQEEKYRKFRHAREGKTLIETDVMVRAGEYARDPVVIPQVTLNQSKFNTVNLQEEIAKGMQQIMDAKEKGEVVENLEGIKKLVEEIPYLQLPREEAQEEEESIPAVDMDTSLQINFQSILSEESDGQISLVMDEKTALERQITGQMTIADVLAEWENKMKAVESAIQAAEQKKLESAKEKALQEAGDIMDRLTDVLPKIEAGVAPIELLEEEYLQRVDEEIEEEIIAEDIFVEEFTEELTEESTEEPTEEPIEEVEEEVVEELVEEPMEDLESKLSEVISDILEEEEETVQEEPSKIKEIAALSEEHKKILSYFVPVKGMEAQICKAVNGILKHLQEDDTACRGNLIVQGTQGSGKTALSTSIIKVIQSEIHSFNGKIGKIDAGALNKKDVQALLKKISGGCLIIEDAGQLERNTAVALSLLLEQDSSGILVILEGTEEDVKKALMLDDGFAKKFTEVVTVPTFNNDELVTFAKCYAQELGYQIDEFAVLALYNRINNIQRLNQATKLEEVKDIIDEAIVREGKFTLRKYFRVLTASRYTDDEQIVITEKDLE